MTDSIPLEDLATVTAGNFDYVVVVQVPTPTTPVARKALLPTAAQAATDLSAGLETIFADAEAEANGLIASAQADIAAAVASIGYLPPVTYTSGISLTSTRETVEYDGDAYAPLASALPFTTSGTFETANFRVIQGIAAADLASTSGAALVGFLQSGTGAVGTTLESEFQDAPLTPEQFGATGDGTTNDTLAFQKLATEINTLGGGAVRFARNKVYIVGLQTFAGATGLGYSYQSEDILYFSGCTKPVIVDMNGSVMKFAAGLKFGSFDPVTGAVYNPASMPFTDLDYRADVGIAIRAASCASFVVLNGEADGNDAAQTVGGTWGDTGYQCIHYGVHAYNCDSVSLENFEPHHMLLDGGATGWTGAVADGQKKPVNLLNVKSHNNGRQGWSWTGGIGFTATDCQFLETGRGAVSSAPASGFDIEAESAVCRDGLFINCTFADNAGTAMVADSGDSAGVRFVKCKFYGCDNVSTWVNKPGFVFEDCLISGESFPGLYVTTNEKLRPRYIRCRFAPDAYNSRPVYGTSLFDSAAGANFAECDFETTNPSIRLGASAIDVNTFTDCKFLQNGSTTSSSIQGRFYGRNHFDMTTGLNNFSGYENYGELTWTGSVLSVEGSENRARATESPPYHKLGLHGSNGGSWDNTVIIKSYQPPTSETWKRGDLCFNANPSATSPIGWACTVAGTPGTWEPFGDMNVTFAASAPTSGTYTRGARVYNTTPSSGGVLGWLCVAAGTPGTWVTFGSVQSPVAYSVTNLAISRTFDANAATTTELAHVVGTVILELQNAGVLKT